MRIGIDISPLIKIKTGIGYYTYYLLESLLKIDKENQYYLYSNQEIKADFLNYQNVNFRFFKKLKIRRLAWQQILLPYQIKKDKIEIFHSPSYFLPIISPPIPMIITIHDLSILIYPQKIKKSLRKFIDPYLLIFSAQKAKKIIADSESTKKDIIKILRIPAEKIEVIYLAAQKQEVNFLESPFSFPYILFVGTLEPRKNIVNLIEAFKILKNTTKLPHRLVIAGMKGWQYQEIFKKVKESKLDKEVIFTGYIPAEELPAYYKNADVFVYPSSYEGFGLPPLEAMNYGTPVVTSNVSSLPEVVGDAALLINPQSPGEIADALKNILTNPKLKNDLIKCGFKQAEKFQWEKTAQKTLQIYRKSVIPA